MCCCVATRTHAHTHTHTHLWSGAWSHMLTSVTCTSCAQRCPTLRTLPYNAVHAATDHLDQRIGDPKVRTAQHHGAEDCWWRRREHACAVLCHWLNHFALCFISCCFVCVWCVCVCVCVLRGSFSDTVQMASSHRTHSGLRTGSPATLEARSVIPHPTTTTTTCAFPLCAHAA